ncbi:MAG: hypothetical protein Q4A82_02605 [Corynebacterium sp.]|nr:hypothetical protein [Corynebacterium sp.]
MIYAPLVLDADDAAPPGAAPAGLAVPLASGARFGSEPGFASGLAPG